MAQDSRSPEGTKEMVSPRASFVPSGLSFLTHFLTRDSRPRLLPSVPSGLLRTLLCIAFILYPSSFILAQFPSACDKDKSCVGNALTISITQGKGAQYVDVDTSYQLENFDTAITFEAWIDPQPQPGKIQYIAGLWGPNKDNNDQWVLFIQDTKIYFALSKDNSYKGDSDNTVAVASVPDLYTNGWRHVAAVWDAQSTAARIYIDGVLVATVTNPLYPLTKLHVPEDNLLPLQIGSCNGLNDDPVTNRTFLGQIDEVRLWSRALSAQEIACQRLVSLNGNEPGLELYYRCNEDPSVQFLCDATGHNHFGQLRSGAACDSSGRTVPLTYTSLPALVNTKLTCTQDTDFTFTITDTSLCGDKVWIGLYGPYQGLYSLSTNTLTLTQGAPQSFTVHLHTDLIGPLTAGIWIANANSCGDPLGIPLNIQRATELNYSLDRLDLDTLYVGCQTTTYSEKTLTICNPGPRTVTLTNISLDSNHFTWTSPGLTFPKSLPPGGCVTVTVRMDMIDSSHTFLDTLRVFSDELCPGSGVIPITGRVQDVLGILQVDGKTPLDSMKFGEVCPGFISGTQSFQYRSLGSDTVFVDSIIYSPANFFGAGIVFPMVLLPKTAYQPTYARFRPDVPGPLTGTMTVHALYHGCDIVKTVQLSGSGYSVDVDFLSPQVAFGNVTIGKTAVQTVQIVDSGVDPRAIDDYLKMGDVFTIVGGNSYKLNPGQQAPITIQFRPRQPITYYDTLTIFDEGCYQTKSIPVQGTGVFQAFSFNPPYLDLAGVVGCSSGTGTIILQNISGSSLAITSCVLNDATGKFSVAQLLPAGPFANNQTFAFTVTYAPNDVNVDRADEAYIDITLSDGEVYHVLLRATSLAPRLYVTPLTTYGVVEVGWQRQDSILLQNASNVSERIPSITIPYGFKLISATPPLPATLAPRDSMWLIVEFQPTGDSLYDENFAVQVDSPCVNTYSGELTGTGHAVKLDVPISYMNYGLVKPCDCATREIPLANYSNLVPITLDSIWIDGFGVTPLLPSTFHWTLKSTGNETLPIILRPQTFDTLEVSFCPNIPATKANLVKNDTLHIMAHAPGWNATFTTLLSGRREMNFQPNVTLVQFPATRVDTSAQPQAVSLTVPDVTINPDGDSIVIDKVSFQPDQQVFTASASTGAPLPWVIQRNQKFSIKVNFFPRAPKVYTARMLIHTIYPCNGTDTTVLVMGSGFAPAFGLRTAFDTAKMGQDTIHLTTCDTLVLPIMSSRDIPQKYMDIYFHIGYDSTELQLLDGSSPYTPTVNVLDSTGGAYVTMKNGIDIKAGTIVYVRFKVIGGPGIFPITLDQFNFDSDSLVFFEIIATDDHGYVEIDQPTIAMTKMTNFDTVNVKQCKDEIVTVYNTGVIPVRFDSLAGLPEWHTVTASSIPVPATLAPGDSVQLTVTFCPRDSAVFDTTITAYSNEPCLAIDTGTLMSIGYAPPYPFKMALVPDLAAVDSIGGRIMDTVEVPIVIDRSIPLTPLDMRYKLQYNPRALEYLSASSSYTVVQDSGTPGLLNFTLPMCWNVDSGIIARVKFLAAVPDSITTTMTLTPGKFTSDSIMFIKPRPVGDTSTVSIAARCNISRLDFVGGSNAMLPARPNPTSGIVTVDLSFVGDAMPTLDIVNSAGATALELMDGSTFYKGGSYHIEFDSRKLAAGAYYMMFQAGEYRASERFVVIR
ncbi:MAG TPA: choice-of-anchor D domain-containing protein [Candidatus Kapabacteria bacterium]|nr:choice-of-anchor D domain-containing protein [Candidatus Kapabacteria bacterium]